MKKKHASKAIWWLCWMIALPGAAFAGEPTAAKAKTTAESQKATSLFHAIRTDADQIRARTALEPQSGDSLLAEGVR